MRKSNFKTQDGQILKCYEYKPDGEIKGIVQIAHGLAEHAGRYSDFANFLCQNGYFVFIADQRLHGKTGEENLGVTDNKDIFPVMVNDQIEISEKLIKRIGKPLVLIGHSYGSFEAQKYIQDYNKACGVILSGSAYMKRPDTALGNIVSNITCIKNGTKPAKLIEKLMFGGFNKKVGTGHWICSNEKVVIDYLSSPYCGHPLCNNFYHSMFKNTRKLYGQGIKNVDKKLPILIASGKNDPVGGMCKHTDRLYKFYKSHGLNVKYKLYDNMRHEILNEKRNKTVYEDILKFINKCVEQQN